MESGYAGMLLQDYVASQSGADCIDGPSGRRNVRRANNPVDEEIFVNCSRYELGFWDMAWELRQ